LGAMAILVHGVRLNVLEFSSHLNMEWSGTEYAPYKYSPSPLWGEGRGKGIKK
jgi:vacuolar-type H+-ATPase subunit I/STV1